MQQAKVSVKLKFWADGKEQRKVSLEHLKISDLNHRQLYRYRVSVLASA